MSVSHKEPRYLYEKLTGGQERGERTHRTRQHYHTLTEDGLEDRGLLEISPGRLEITNSSWRWRGGKLYNQLPAHFKTGSHKMFKSQVIQWVKLNV